MAHDSNDRVPKSAGEAVICAVIRAKAIQSVELFEDGSRLFVWAANAPEQLEAALRELGYVLTPTSDL